MVNDILDQLIAKLKDGKPVSRTLLASAAQAIGDLHNEYIDTYRQFITIGVEYENLNKKYLKLQDTIQLLIKRLDELENTTKSQ